jgi:hypothetical protein
MIFSLRRSSTKQPFEEVRGPNETAAPDRQPQVRDAGLEIVLETGERARQDVAVVSADAGRQLARDRPRWVARALNRPWVPRDLRREIAHPVRQAALTRQSRKAFARSLG